jgi:hypothetical protein
MHSLTDHMNACEQEYALIDTRDWWTVEIEGMPHFEMAMKRVYAWYQNEIIDRPPVRFMAHNAFLEAAKEDIANLSPQEKEAWWFDAELQIDLFIKSIQDQRFHAETFPVYFPNLGPDVYAAFYGTQLIFGEVTSWSVPLIKDWGQLDELRFDKNNVYFKKIEELTQCALERCSGKSLVGYTDLHPGLDCAAAWRDPQQFCIDLIDQPHQAKRLLDIAIQDFECIYNHFDEILKAAGQLSVSWMGIPSFGRMHIPSCDLSTLISPAFYAEFGLPILRREVQTMTHNIFHMDGKGVARHLDSILSVPEVHAIQWVQGVGDDYPIMQWVPFIKKLQSHHIPVIVDLSLSELEGFIDAMDPHGLFLWVATVSEDQEIDIVKRLNHWS